MPDPIVGARHDECSPLENGLYFACVEPGLVGARLPSSWSLELKSNVLTPRLRECLMLARDGLTAIQIGDALGLSYRTVNQYLSDAYRRLGARNRTQAVAIAAQRGEIPTTPPPAE